MEEFIRNVREEYEFTAPTACQNALLRKFPDAVNINWFQRGTCFEAVFYKDNLEHIAEFDSRANLKEYRLSFPEDLLPGPIRSFLDREGEIMNLVLRNKGNTIEYEVIVRDSELKRHMILLSALGRLITKQQL